MVWVSEGTLELLKKLKVGTGLPSMEDVILMLLQRAKHLEMTPPEAPSGSCRLTLTEGERGVLIGVLSKHLEGELKGWRKDKEGYILEGIHLLSKLINPRSRRRYYPLGVPEVRSKLVEWLREVESLLSSR